MRVRITIPESQVTSDVIDSGLEALTRLNAQQIAAGSVPTFGTALAAGRVRWEPEPPGDECFDHAGLVLARGHGDCDDLAPWQAASLRVTGVDPGARARVVKSGRKTWHAIVQRSDGSVDDPSRAAGMGEHPSMVSGSAAGVLGIAPAVTAPMFATRRAAISVAPYEGSWYARADVPWMGQPGFAWSATAADPYAPQALHAAIAGACMVASGVGIARDDVARLFVADAIASGVDPRRVLAGMYEAGMALDGPSFTRAAIVGAKLCQGRCKRLAARL